VSYWTLELKALQQSLPQIERLGATLVAITPDTGAALASAKRENGLAYEVLSDVDNGVGLMFGIIFRVPEAIRALYRRLGIDLGTRHGNSTDGWLLPLPATYIVDRPGIIRHAEFDPDFKRRMEPAEIVRVVGDLAAGR
jgi:peroxiredoxin